MRSGAVVSVASAARFLASGGFNTLITYLGYLVLLRWFSYRLSYTLAFASGIALAYALNRYFVFRRSGGRFGPLLIAMTYGAQYLLGLAIVSAWVDWLGGPARIAPLIAIAISLPLTYLCSAAVFGDDGASQEGAGGGLSRSRAKWLLRRVAIIILIGLPCLSLALNALGWLRSGFDLPFYDDWRSYATGQIASLHPAYLFMGLNDTMAPVGFALDALAQRLLNGNSIAYQLLSMLLVLGSLLLLQWKLLRAVLGDRLQTAACFVFTLFMLQPGSYWGRENLAYHQALPLIFILASLWLIAFSNWRASLRLPAIFALGSLAGMSYISGAFGGLAAAIGLLLVVLLGIPAGRRTHLLAGGATLGLAGLLAVAVQFFVAVLPNLANGQRGDAPLALPYQRDFWFFYLGKVGRALLLPETLPGTSMAVVILVCGAAVGVAFLVLRRLKADPQGPWRSLALVYGALGAMIFVYLLLVAAGRTNLRGPEIQTATEVFALGFTRFHFFWVTLLWPWVIAGGLVLVRTRWPVVSQPQRFAAWAVCAGGISAVIAGGGLDHFERHEMEAAFRKETVSCLITQLQRGEGIDCPEFNTPDLTPAYIHASRIGASFVRYFPVLPIEIGVNEPAPWFRLSRDTAHFRTENITAGGAGSYVAGPDSQIHIRTGRPDDMANCVMLEARARLGITQDAQAQVFFRPLGQRQFDESHSRLIALRADAKSETVGVRVESETGFEDALRFDPVDTAQAFALPDLEVRCRLRYPTTSFFTLGEPTLKGQLLGSAWLDAIKGVPNGYHAGKDAEVIFRTSQRLRMAQCSLLRVEAKLAVQEATRAQLYFSRRGSEKFIERDSVALDVGPIREGQPLEFRVHSATGFEDRLRLDPVEHKQDIRIWDVRVSCLRRLAPRLGMTLPAAVVGN